MRQNPRRIAPAREIPRQIAQRFLRLGRQLVGLHDFARRRQQRHLAGARELMQRLHAGVADAALGLVDDALEGEVVIALRHQP